MTTITKTVIDLVKDGNVPGNSSDIALLGGGPIPAGETWRVVRFGGSELGAGDGVASGIVLQYGDSSGGWNTIRGFGLSSNVAEIQLDRDFVGDGVKGLRLIRQNKTSTAKQIIAWIQGFKKA